MPKIASPETYFLKIFWGIPPQLPSALHPPGTRNTPTGYFQILADYFKICGEHCDIQTTLKQLSADVSAEYQLAIGQNKPNIWLTYCPSISQNIGL